MKLINRYTDYAVRALCVMAKEPETLYTVKKLIDLTGVPRPFLRKIFQILNRKHIINSFKGKGGGFRLNMQASKINLLVLVNALQGKFAIMEHTLRGRKCPNQSTCRLKREMDKIEKKLLAELKNLTIVYIADI